MIGNLAVRPQYRGRGIGEQILIYAEKQAKETGARRLALRVAIENKTAKKLYEDLASRPRRCTWNQPTGEGGWGGVSLDG